VFGLDESHQATERSIDPMVTYQESNQSLVHEMYKLLVVVPELLVMCICDINTDMLNWIIWMETLGIDGPSNNLPWQQQPVTNK
jgi:hypothetical protein